MRCVLTEELPNCNDMHEKLVTLAAILFAARAANHNSDQMFIALQCQPTSPP
jgi:hypothetical protein